MTSHTQTCIIAGIWCVPKKYMNCHKVPLNFGDDKKQTDKTDYPDAFFVADFIYSEEYTICRRTITACRCEVPTPKNKIE